MESIRFVDTITDTAAVYKYINDQTLLYINENNVVAAETKVKAPQTKDADNLTFWLLLTMTCFTVGSCGFKRLKQ